MNRFIDQKRKRNLGLNDLDGRLACWSSARQIRTLLRRETTFRNPFNPTFHVPSTLGHYQLLHRFCGSALTPSSLSPSPSLPSLALELLPLPLLLHAIQHSSRTG